MQWSKINKIIVLMALLGLVFFVCGCQEKAETSGTAHTSLKPQLELVQEKSLGSVAENKIPDVTKSGWSYGVPFTKPVVFPDGKYVLVVGEEKMTLYDTSSGAQKWEKSTYGGIDSYIIGNNRLYMTEKYAYKRDKEHGYIICLDIDTGDELWKYDVQADLAPAVKNVNPRKPSLIFSVL